MTGGPGNRRPLASRDAAWARRTARWLSAGRVTPNAISTAGVLVAAAGGLALALSAYAGGWMRAALLLAAAAACQLRLACNLLDGMVAIEGGRAAPDGPFWNEAPDRLSDIMLLVGAGHAAGQPALGWAAAAFAVLTAYVRELGRGEGFSPDFSGPMAKQHRMAVLTGGAVLGAVLPAILSLALWAIALGAAATALRRSWRLVRALRSRSRAEPAGVRPRPPAPDA
ncbi:MAG: CDP-alcohol phosphatidyltransferase family protein [Rhodobacteraceae bacterium]|nr:CDP-alcohol phosphatidyltransferase family protein [Paracoccaceae bacterium]